uniref:Uncharacterized protein n=1 Tax=Opuntia streptacantha TaxID=393608 RepID=A0A7C9AAT6_OPUST
MSCKTRLSYHLNKETFIWGGGVEETFFQELCKVSSISMNTKLGHTILMKMPCGINYSSWQTVTTSVQRFSFDGNKHLDTRLHQKIWTPICTCGSKHLLKI